MTMLPPTPEEVRAFVADTAVGAYERAFSTVGTTIKSGLSLGRPLIAKIRSTAD
jgi:hypothetical protein